MGRLSFLRREDSRVWRKAEGKEEALRAGLSFQFILSTRTSRFLLLVASIAGLATGL
jgi:hypothetical protein